MSSPVAGCHVLSVKMMWCSGGDLNARFLQCPLEDCGVASLAASPRGNTPFCFSFGHILRRIEGGSQMSKSPRPSRPATSRCTTAKFRLPATTRSILPVEAQQVGAWHLLGRLHQGRPAKKKASRATQRRKPDERPKTAGELKQGQRQVRLHTSHQRKHLLSAVQWPAAGHGQERPIGDTHEPHLGRPTPRWELVSPERTSRIERISGRPCVQTRPRRRWAPDRQMMRSVSDRGSYPKPFQSGLYFADCLNRLLIRLTSNGVVAVP